MNISFSPRQHIGFGRISYNSNNNASKNAVNNNKKIKKDGSINKNGMVKSSIGKSKQNNILENLMKQKENLMESKNAIKERSLKNGEDSKSIQEKMKNIDKQIEEIDKQLNEIKLQEQRKPMGVEDKDNKNKESKQKSKNDSVNGVKVDKSMENILDLSSNLSQAKELSSQRTIMSGEARVLENEIKTDEQRGIDPVRKKKRLSKVNDNIEKISQNISNNLNDVNKNSSIQSDNNTDENKQSNEVSSSINTQNPDKLLIQQQKIAQNIKQYKDNMKDDSNHNNEKINITA
ncbi:hypothetical protein [Clostridium brassicae]|uniref:Viral A-type inclusion protein n=1 Tax=Clostridium brassicae TaxID=2999072 RepID=A0ABT4D7P2_9CLOT|nr:hypothetical protein [Clostridium brassicae]MCY6958317.1 hypothetical protein [Clostridium brassicae]